MAERAPIWLAMIMHGRDSYSDVDLDPQESQRQRDHDPDTRCAPYSIFLNLPLLPAL